MTMPPGSWLSTFDGDGLYDECDCGGECLPDAGLCWDCQADADQQDRFEFGID